MSERRVIDARRDPRRYLTCATVLLAVALLSACGDGTPLSPPAPDNRSPVAQAPIPSQTVEVGGTISLGVASFFRDPDGDALTYAATSADRGVGTASVSGSTVTVVGVAEGRATVTVTATDPGGLSARQPFTVEVSASSGFTGLLERFVEQNRIGAAALGIMRDGDIIYEGTTGFMDAARRVPVPDNVMMRIASITKPITAAAIHKLAADGRLALGDRAFDVGQSGGGLLSLEPFPELGDSRLADITVLHLLRHRGGWDRDIAPDWVFREIDIATRMSIRSPPGRENMVRFILGQPLQFRPGARRAYSNIGYLVLGLIVEKVSGQDYMSFVRQNIFSPLGVPPEDVIPGRTFPRDRSPREPWYDGPTGARNVFDPSGPRVPWPDGGWHHEAKVGHGGLVASTRALLAFLDEYVAWGDDTGRPRRKPEGAGWYTYHTGSLSGTNALAYQRGNGINYVILFNRRSGSDPSYVSQFMELLNHELGI